jgi:hypothetical protein
MTPRSARGSPLSLSAFPAFPDQLSLYPWPTPKQEGQDEQNDKHNEENVSNPRRFARYAAESKYFGDNGYDQKKKCPT